MTYSTDRLRQISGQARAALERITAAKRRSGFTVTLSVTEAAGPPPDHANPHRLDATQAQRHDRILLKVDPIKQPVPGAELSLTLWAQPQGVVLQPVTMVEVWDENTGEKVRKYDDEHKPLVIPDASDPPPAVLLEEHLNKWYSKLVKAIDKEIDRRIRLGA